MSLFMFRRNVTLLERFDHAGVAVAGIRFLICSPCEKSPGQLWRRGTTAGVFLELGELLPGIAQVLGIVQSKYDLVVI